MLASHAGRMGPNRQTNVAKPAGRHVRASQSSQALLFGISQRRGEGSRCDEHARSGREGVAMSTDQILFGVGLIVVLAVGSQVVANRLRIPGLIVLLPAGFTAGALTKDVNPQHLLGAAFQPLVSVAVA